MRRSAARQALRLGLPVRRSDLVKPELIRRDDAVTLVYGAPEPKSGAIVSTIRAADLPGLNHRFQIVSGIREAECRGLMVEFFRERRA